MRLIGCPGSPGSCASDCSVVNSRLSSRAAPWQGPVAPAPEEAAAEPGPNEVAGFPEGGPVPGMPWFPLAPARRTSLTAAELLKAVRGMLAVNPLDGKVPGGRTWLSERIVEGLGVVSDRRLLMAASREALEDSGRERFLVIFWGRGSEALAPERQSLEGLVPKGASPEAAEAGCSWGRAAAAVVMQGGGCAADSKGGTPGYRLDGF